MTTGGTAPPSWHRRALEGRGAVFALAVTVVMAIGGAAEIAPMFTAEAGTERLDWVTPYTPLEVAGRDLYVREGCYNCHSQMVRPFRSETLRYGPWSRAGEYAFDRPFQLGSRRIGPDLMREGGKYGDSWQYGHLRDPRSLVKGSIMPAYTWLLDATVDPDEVAASVRALASLGVPYSAAEVAGVPSSLRRQGDGIALSLAAAGIASAPDREVVAMIAYLQRLGREGKEALASEGRP